MIGSGPLYTRQTCMHVQNEFEVVCRRLEVIDQAWDIQDQLNDLRLLIVDERHAGDLAERCDLYLSLSPRSVVSMSYRDPAVARRFRDAWPGENGTIGFLPMKVPLEAWLSMIRLLMHREFCLPHDLLQPCENTGARPAAKVAANDIPEHDTEERLTCLTGREQEVLQLVSAGQSNKMIARSLSISEHTVKLHVHHLSRKLGVSNRTEAATVFLSMHPVSGSYVG